MAFLQEELDEIFKLPIQEQAHVLEKLENDMMNAIRILKVKLGLNNWEDIVAE